MAKKRLRNPSQRWATTFVARAKLIWTDLQVGLVTVGVALLLLLQVTWIRRLVDDYVDVDQLGTTVLVPVILVLVLWQLVEITQRLDSVETGSRDVTGNIHSAVLERIEQTTDTKHQSLHILGLTLRYAWPNTRQWIGEGRLDGWSVSVSAYLPANAEAWIPDDWPEVSEGQLRDAAKYAEEDWVKAKVVLVPYSYTHPPYVHGYLLGNGDIYVAYLQWNRTRTKLRGGAPRYEFIPYADTTSNAQAVRLLFEGWLQAAERQRYEPRSRPA